MMSDHPPAPPVPADESLRFKFVQLQVQYFMAQMTIGEAKAAGVLAFMVAVSGVTTQRLGNEEALPGSVVAGLLAIGLSFIASAFAFHVLWPRRTGNGPEGNVFSWVSVSNRRPDRQALLMSRASAEQLVGDVAESMVDIAYIVRRKYEGVHRALMALIPATALHVLSWLLA